MCCLSHLCCLLHWFTQVTGHSPEVEALEAQGLMEDALLLAGSHVRSELERVSVVRGGGHCWTRSAQWVSLGVFWIITTRLIQHHPPPHTHAHAPKCSTCPHVNTNTHLSRAPVRLTPQVSRNLADDASAKLMVKYALVIDGKALLYALSPMLKDLFLEVRACQRPPHPAHATLAPHAIYPPSPLTWTAFLI